LSVEGESRGEQDEWLRLLIARFFQPKGYTLSGEVSWEGDQSGDAGVIHLDDNRVESVSDSITRARFVGVKRSRSVLIDKPRDPLRNANDGGDPTQGVQRSVLPDPVRIACTAEREAADAMIDGKANWRREHWARIAATTRAPS